MTTKKPSNFNDTIGEAVSVATSVAYTRKEIQKLKTELVSLLEKRTVEPIVEYVNGPQGISGPRGAIGAQGPQGAVGPIGPEGKQGPQGEVGEKGDAGPQGNLGPTGQTGLKGDKGDKGDQGIQGEQGIQGVTGDRGEKGEKGNRGADGKNGLDGKDGQTGALGPVGPVGPQGVQGERGLNGDKGERGKDGQQGLAGPTGPQGEIGPQGVQGIPGKDGKDGDIKPVEDKFQKFVDNVQKDVNAFKTKVNAVVSKGFPGGGSHGGGEVNLRYLDDVDTTNLADGKVLSYNSANSKFEFLTVSGVGGDTDLTARSAAGSAFNKANTAFDLANSAFNAANTGGVAGIDTLARTTANTANSVSASAFAKANSALSIAQSAFAQANTGGGGGATESLNVQFDNTTGVAYKVVALDVTANTVLASALDIAQVDKVLGVLDISGETVTFGSITNVSWTWTPEQSLYLGSNGDIVATSTINGAAFSIKIGYAISTTKAFIKIGTPIVL